MRTIPTAYIEIIDFFILICNIMEEMKIIVINDDNTESLDIPFRM